jgi:hypothetical protein
LKADRVSSFQLRMYRQKRQEKLQRKNNHIQQVNKGTPVVPFSQ